MGSAKWTGSLPSRARPTIWCGYETWRPFQRCRSGPKCARRRLELDLGPEKHPKLSNPDIINDDNHKEESSTHQFFSSLLGGLAGLATVLTSVGLFAVVSYLVRERTKELGIRMAIGATRGDVMKLVLNQSLKLSLLGTVIGFVLTLAVARLMTSLMYAIHPRDPAIFLAVAILVAVISILAAYIPARRAAGIQPLAALRED